MSEFDHEYDDYNVIGIPSAELPMAFKTIPVTEFARLDQYQWIVKGILPQAELAVIFGEPGCGKTFLALDVAMSVARGIDWEHKRTTQGRVVYIAAEGTHGFKKRTLAYLTHHKIDLKQPLELDIIPDSPNFLSEMDATKVAASVGKASVIIIDTFSRVLAGGNENSGEDMGFAILQCKILHQLTGALIILIHHSGKDTAKGARGWSGLLGACDTEIEVEKFLHGHKAKITKQKDGEDGIEWGFDLKVVELGEDEDGDQITSCVYESTNSVPIPERKDKKPKERGDNEKRIIKAFNDIGGIYIAADDIVKYAMKSMVDESNGKRDTRKQVLMRAINTLESNNFLINNNGIISIC